MTRANDLNKVIQSQSDELWENAEPLPPLSQFFMPSSTELAVYISHLLLP